MPPSILAVYIYDIQARVHCRLLKSSTSIFNAWRGVVKCTKGRKNKKYVFCTGHLQSSRTFFPDCAGYEWRRGKGSQEGTVYLVCTFSWACFAPLPYAHNHSKVDKKGRPPFPFECTNMYTTLTAPQMTRNYTFCMPGINAAASSALVCSVRQSQFVVVTSSFSVYFK